MTSGPVLSGIYLSTSPVLPAGLAVSLNKESRAILLDKNVPSCFCPTHKAGAPLEAGVLEE